MSERENNYYPTVVQGQIPSIQIPGGISFLKDLSLAWKGHTGQDVVKCLHCWFCLYPGKNDVGFRGDSGNLPSLLKFPKVHQPWLSLRQQHDTHPQTTIPLHIFHLHIFHLDIFHLDIFHLL